MSANSPTGRSHQLPYPLGADFRLPRGLDTKWKDFTIENERPLKLTYIGKPLIDQQSDENYNIFLNNILSQTLDIVVFSNLTSQIYDELSTNTVTMKKLLDRITHFLNAVAKKFSLVVVVSPLEDFRFKGDVLNSLFNDNHNLYCVDDTVFRTAKTTMFFCNKDVGSATPDYLIKLQQFIMNRNEKRTIVVVTSQRPNMGDKTIPIDYTIGSDSRNYLMNGKNISNAFFTNKSKIQFSSDREFMYDIEFSIN